MTNYRDKPLRDPSRIHVALEKIRQYWILHPELRLGQILSSLASDVSMDTFYLEEWQLIEVIEDRLRKEAER